MRRHKHHPMCSAFINPLARNICITKQPSSLKREMAVCIHIEVFLLGFSPSQIIFFEGDVVKVLLVADRGSDGFSQSSAIDIS
jgi:hypothetical protein